MMGRGLCAAALLLGMSGLGCKNLREVDARDVKEKAMQTQEIEKKAFSPHPGKIMFWTMWNHTVKVENADDVPDANKFVYYDAEQMETHDQGKAVRRVPIVEVEMSSYDADGHLVDISKSVRIAVAEFGLHHEELRHSSGPGPLRGR